MAGSPQVASGWGLVSAKTRARSEAWDFAAPPAVTSREGAGDEGTADRQWLLL